MIKIYLLFYMCHFAMGLTHCYKTTVFFTFIWGMLQEKVYCSRIHDVKELKDDAAAADDDVC